MDLKKVTVIVPCRNEEKFIEKVINNLLSQTYPRDKLEILFVDGLSEDRTREIIKAYAQKYSFIKLIDNPYKFVPQAMNIGINNATGDIIIRMDAHSEYPNDYIEKLVTYLEKLKADNVGGIWINTPPTNSLKAKAIALALSSKFGVGNALYRLGELREPSEVDTVPFGCYKKEIFSKIGLYDEDLIRNQDDELNARLRKYGGKIFLVPDVKIKYFTRDSWTKLFKMFYQYGYFKPLVNLKLGQITTWRQLIPPLFVIVLIISLLLSFLFKKALFIFVILSLFYFTFNLLVSLLLSFSSRNLKLLPFLIISFFLIHFSYGLGYLKGILDFIILKKHLKKKLEVELTR